MFDFKTWSKLYFSLLPLICCCCATDYRWKEEVFPNVPVDHFSFDLMSETFDLRYLINDTWWDRNNSGPIFFYAGNEGYIEEFAENTGLMWDWAPQFKALLLFAEHRYYGKTMPFGNLSLTNKYLGKLSAEQAMGDYALLLDWIKRTLPGAKNAPVIAFGGSYAGMLVAWMRQKYPNLILGAVASSAPIRQLTGGDSSCDAFAKACTQAYAKQAPGCGDAINASFTLLWKKLETEDGRLWLQKTFRLCNDSLLDDGDHGSDFITWVAESWKYLAMYTYPYPTSMSGDLLPAWPAKKACTYMINASTDDEDTLLKNVFKSISVYRNYTGDKQCYRLQITDPVDDYLVSWGYQQCTELTMPRCQTKADIFTDVDWNMKSFSGLCRERYGIEPRVNNFLTLNYGVEVLKRSSNIIFSNGELDPWFLSCVNKQSIQGGDPTLEVINILNASHHYDLRSAHPLDTKEIIAARNQIKTIVQNWLLSTGRKDVLNVG